MRKPLMSGNWKMHHTHLEAIAMVQKLSYLLFPEDYEAVDVSVHPPFTALRSIQTLLDADGIPIALGAQNCHWEASGPYTGEIAPPMLAKLDVQYVIVGHSERRQLFGETNETVNKKVKAVLAAGMTPILAIGETLEERGAGLTERKCLTQAEAGLAGLAADQVGGMVVAYEPIWAIGTGQMATPDDAENVIGGIRRLLGRLYGEAVASTVRIQYGGSVNPTNVAEIMRRPDIDGALVGGASLDAEEFSRIIRYKAG